MPPIQVDSWYAVVAVAILVLLKLAANEWSKRIGTRPAIRKDIDGLREVQTEHGNRLDCMDEKLDQHGGKLEQIYDHLTQPSRVPPPWE